MFGRIFGRDKADREETTCAACGRTLLAGEWTRTITDDEGRERLLCSLCAQKVPPAAGEGAAAAAPRGGRRAHTPRSGSVSVERDSDAFWRALKEREAEIERLREALARREAEVAELRERLARYEGAAPAPAPPPAGEEEEATWGETPAEFAAELAALEEEAAPVQDIPLSATDVAAMPPVAGAPPVAAGEPAAGREPAAASEVAEGRRAGEERAAALEDTQPLSAAEVMAADEATGDLADTGALAAVAPPAGEDEATGAAAEAGTPTEAGAAAEAAGAAETAAAGEAGAADEAGAAEAASSLTLLQRGIDLLNVSHVPRKIAETTEHLGLPLVNVGFDGETVAATFLWSMGWYRYHVDVGSGEVRLADRGYDDRRDLQPNASVRGDGTVQLAPARISRAAAQKETVAREAAPGDPGAAGGERAARPREPEPPSVAAQKPPEILSKSLLGQRSDDEPASWEQTRARDFDWDR